ncbi:MAG: YgfZ/GcvT domain-containing protein [Gammaproteobacteria bacterium]
MANKHQAGESAARVCELSQSAAIQVSGNDRTSFLQGQLTQDVDLLTPATTLLSGWCSVKGRLLMIAQMFAWQDAIWLVVPAELATEAAKRLQMFVLRADVRISLSEMQILGLNSLALHQLAKHRQLSITQGAAASDNTACMGYLPGDDGRGIVITDASEMTQMLKMLRNECGAVSISTAEWELENIRAGIPTVFADTRESFVPQMLNLEKLGGVSFTKGCYVGQEIVARAQNLGKIKRRMHTFSTNGDQSPLAGESIYNGERAVGEIVTAAADGEHSLLLGVVPSEQLNAQFSLQTDGQQPIKLIADP